MEAKENETVEEKIIRFTERLKWFAEELILEEPLFQPPPGGRADYRRMAARLRAGELESPNPELTAEEFADYLDLCVEQQELRQQFAKEAFAFAEFLQTTIDERLEKIWEQCKDLYKVAKKMAEEQGPDSGAAEFCRLVKPMWREVQGEHKGRSRNRASRGTPARRRRPTENGVR